MLSAELLLAWPKAEVRDDLLALVLREDKHPPVITCESVFTGVIYVNTASKRRSQGWIHFEATL